MVACITVQNRRKLRLVIEVVIHIIITIVHCFLLVCKTINNILGADMPGVFNRTSNKRGVACGSMSTLLLNYIIPTLI